LVERYESIRPYIKPENLNTNYRSSAEVINFNNALFEAIKVDPEYLAIAPSLPRVYDEYFAQKYLQNLWRAVMYRLILS
jgi:ATP-dependent exoDNAse (exonuclease V) beta subunit